MRIDVLMPVHNAGQYLATAVHSTMRSLPKSGRILLFDDGSTDGAVDAMPAELKLRVDVEASPVSLGVAAACNRLLSAASAPWVARMDSDDVCLPWRFALQSHLLRDGQCEAVFGGYLRSDSRLRPIGADSSLRLGNEAVSDLLLLGNALCHPSLLASRDAMISAGGYRDVGAEDFDLWLRMVQDGSRLCKIAAPVLVYRTHQGQISKTKNLNVSWAHNAQLLNSYNEVYVRRTGSQIGPAILRDLMTRVNSSEPGGRKAFVEQVRALAAQGNKTTNERLVFNRRISAFEKLPINN
jgi:glycosyltransferase involved in cell wall biosynthesis